MPIHLNATIMKTLLLKITMLSTILLCFKDGISANYLPPPTIYLPIANWSSQQGIEFGVLPYGQVLHNSAPYSEKYNRVSYTINFPQSGYYKPIVGYAAGVARPVNLKIDGNMVYSYLAGGVTGGWNWANQSVQSYENVIFYISSGWHTITLDRNGSFPHISQLRLVAV